ncbi:MAG: hypothetical protein H6550_09025 [Chitinophagales bacterium]|nr:hypothetical protein [Chitinophagales bacterium]
MRNFILLLTLSISLLTSCNKPSSTPAQVTEENSYIVAGVVDIKMGNADSSEIALAVSHQTGIQKKITFSLTGLPQYAYVTFDPAGGTVPFNTIMTINTYVAKTGVYPIKLLVTPETGTAKEYTFNLTIDESKPCNEIFYNALRQLEYPEVTRNGSTVVNDTRIYFDQNSKKLFFTKTILQPGKPGEQDYVSYESNGPKDGMAFEIDCDNATINIPAATIKGSAQLSNPVSFQVNGSGTVNWATKTYELEYNSVSQSNETNTYKIKGKLK